MPFGYYDAVRTARKAKAKKPPVKPPEQELIKNLVDPPEQKTKKKQKAVDRLTDFPDKTPGTMMDVNILLVGRTVEAAADFVAGLHMNMSVAASENGLAFYSEDLNTIRELLQKQKQIPLLFLNGEIAYKLCDMAEADVTTRKTYQLLLSVSGRQGFSFKINFQCVTAAEAFSDDLFVYSALWVLADAPLYDGDAPDSYGSGIASLLAAARDANLPAYIIAGQFEKLGKIRNTDSICAVERSVYSDLKQSVLKSFGAAAEGLPVIPVQIYGGLVYKETDHDGSLILGENRYGGLSMYKPEACHLPLFFTLEALSAGALVSDNDIIPAVKRVNRAQRREFSAAGIETGG